MNNKSEYAIGVFDSGMGGLTVAHEIMRQLPQETIYYLGDNKRCPYGPRSKEEVRQFTLEIVQFLMQFPLKAMVIACNTATAAALQDVKDLITIPVLGVIEPGVRAAIKVTKRNRIGVIGTLGTIQSAAYEKTLKRIHPGLTIHSLACPTFVPLVESGHYETPLAEEIVVDSLQPFQGTGIDTLILGCTHYPLLAAPISKAIGSEVEVVSSAEETATELSSILYHQGLLATTQYPKHRFFTTGSVQSFAAIAESWLGERVEVEEVDLEPIKM